jgi:hypothetical protein
MFNDFKTPDSDSKKESRLVRDFHGEFFDKAGKSQLTK